MPTHARSAARKHALACLTIGSLAIGPAGTIAQAFVPPPDANIVSVTAFGATPNGGTDDLPAFQAALNATVGTGRILFVPNGLYNFSGRLDWGGIGSGGFFTMQGESKAGVILRLDDALPAFATLRPPLPSSTRTRATPPTSSATICAT
jgi:hypothetical protein